MKTKPSIYSNCNPQLTTLFDQAPHPAKVLCVALDFAKAQHCVLLCNGLGDVLKAPFAVANTDSGAKELLAQVRASAKSAKVASQHIFFSGEDCPSFAENFLRRLRKDKFLVVRVNAAEAKQQRDNHQASTDRLDLLAIARCTLKRKAQTVTDWPPAYANLRVATRDRDKLVRQRTANSNRMYTYVDRLFPGFLNSPALTAFGEASLDLMSENFSPEQIRPKPLSSLRTWLARRHVPQPQEAATALKALAKSVSGPPTEQRPMLQCGLTQAIALHRGLSKSIELLDREVAYWLARTPGALLTSIAGIGVTLAAGWSAELGPTPHWRSVRRLCSYAGVVPRTSQTGGPDKPAVTGPVGQRCNKRFKNVLLLSVEKLRRFGSEDWLQTAAKLENQGSHVEFALAKRLIRLAKYLVTMQTAYIPKALLAPETPKTVRCDYYRQLWPKLLEKWKDKANVQEVFAPEHPLGKWRIDMQTIYGLELPVPHQRALTAPARRLLKLAS